MIRVSDVQLADWFDQIAGGLDAGMTSVNAVALAKDLPQGVSAILSDSFGRGNNWATSLEEVNLSLSVAELAILGASEQSATMPQAMRRLAVTRRDQAKAKKKMFMAIAYPAFILHFGAVVFSISYLLDGRMAAFFVSTGMVLVPIWLIAILMVVVARVSPRSLKAVSRFMPLFSGYRKNWDLGILCNVLANCMRAGMQVNRAWEAAVVAADNPRVYKLGDSVIGAIEAGRPASEGIVEAGKCVPKSFYQLYRTGEETGSLEQNLEAAGDSYVADAKSKLTLASAAYPKLLMLGIFGYAGYKVVMFYKDYFAKLSEITM